MSSLVIQMCEEDEDSTADTFITIIQVGLIISNMKIGKSK